MDVFFEQIIRKKPNTLQIVMKIVFLIVAVLLICLLLVESVLMLMTGSLGSLLSSICILAAFGAGYFTYRYIRKMYIEYEYSITNGDFDIDRILGKSKRDRIISTNCKDFEEFGVYNEAAKERLLHRNFDSKVLAANLDEEGLYYAVVAHKTAGCVLVVIEPNERIISALKKFIPREIQHDVFGH